MLLLFIFLILALVIAKLVRFTSSFIVNFIVAMSVGMLVFTHITLMSSFLFGFGTLSMIIGLLLIVPVAFVLRYGPNKPALTGLIPKYFLIVALTFICLALYIFITQTLFSTNEGLISGSGGMFGDTALHASYTSRIESGEFPIQNPLYAGKILVYPLANDLLSAALKSFGFNFNLAFSIPQIIFMSVFIILFYKISRIFTSEKGSVISILILLLGWGVGWVFFIREFLGQDLSFWQFLKVDYTNNEFYNLRFHNILTGLILPERSLLPGLVLGLFLVLYWMEFIRSGKLRFVLVSAIILGMLPFWHTHTFIFFTIFSLICLTYSFYINRNWRMMIQSSLLFGLISGTLAFPFFYLFIQGHAADNFIRFKLGWTDEMGNIIFFWLKNSFLIIPIAIFGFIKLKNRERIYFVPAFIVFIIANLIIFQPWDWDNIKLISWSFIFFSILVGSFLARFMNGSLILKFLTTLIIATSTLSGILSITLQLKGKYLAFDKKDIELAQFANKNTSRSSVFVVDPVPNHPIPNLAGRLVYLGYPGHLWVHGIDYVYRERENNLVLQGDIALAKTLYPRISYVVLGPSYVQNNFLETQLVFQNSKFRVFKI